jgi:hypothetical protein
MIHPGFTAAFSLYTSTRYYRTSTTRDAIAGSSFAPLQIIGLPTEDNSRCFTSVEECQYYYQKEYEKCVRTDPFSLKCADILSEQDSCRAGCKSPYQCTADVSNAAFTAGQPRPHYCCRPGWIACNGQCLDISQCSAASGATFSFQTCNCGCGNPSQVVCDVGGELYCATLGSNHDCTKCGDTCSDGRFCNEDENGQLGCHCGEQECPDGTCAPYYTQCCQGSPQGYCDGDTPTCCPPGACTNLDTDQNNCGTCGNSCLAVTQTCVQGQCTCVDPNSQICRGICVDTSVSDTNCGECENVCSGGQICVNGLCTCPDNLTLCAGDCIDLSNDTQNCGECGFQCATGQVCCNGTCVNVLVDPNNCGSCGNKCAPGQSCCNKRCVDLNSDQNNCGSCGNKCAPGQSCCNKQCVDVTADANNCGSCGNKCAPGQSCCNQNCADLTSNPNNCASCGHSCSITGPLSGQSFMLDCVNSTCVCPASWPSDPRWPGQCCWPDPTDGQVPCPRNASNSVQGAGCTSAICCSPTGYTCCGASTGPNTLCPPRYSCDVGACPGCDSTVINGCTANNCVCGATD